MRRGAFLVPAGIAGIAVAAAAVALNLDATWTYALTGVVGFLVLLDGALHDLGVGFKGRKVVEVHEAAIRAEERYRPETRNLPLSEKWDEHGLVGGKPAMIATRRTRVEVLLLQKFQKRGKVEFGHLADLIPKQPA